MMKLLSLSALAGVLAADMPVFSSNDDYDEINLNIRLLKGHNGTEEGPNPNKTYHVVKTEVKTKYTTDLTYQSLCDAVGPSTEAALQTAVAGAKAQVENCGDSSKDYPDHEGHDHRKLQAEKTEKEVKQKVALVFEDPASAKTAAGVVNAADFATTFGAVLATELAKDASLSAAVGAPTVTGVSKAGVTKFKGDKEVTTAPTTAPAPAPTPASSDASMLKVNVALAAVAAVFASMF